MLERSPQGHDEDLRAAVEDQILPHLASAYRNKRSCEARRTTPSLEVIEEIGQMAVAQQTRSLIQRLSQMASEGLSFRALLLEVIAPAADWLGERWMDDTLTFSDVTAGANILERVVAALGADSDPPLRHGELVVLTAAPGEQHVLPVHLLGETLRHEGWAVHVDPSIANEELRRLVSQDEVAAVGFTCSDIERMGGIADLITSLRACSRNTKILFYIGGTQALALRASTYGAVYCSSFDEFLEALGDPEGDSQVFPKPE